MFITQIYEPHLHSHSHSHAHTITHAHLYVQCTHIQSHTHIQHTHAHTQRTHTHEYTSTVLSSLLPTDHSPLSNLLGTIPSVSVGVVCLEFPGNSVLPVRYQEVCTRRCVLGRCVLGRCVLGRCVLGRCVLGRYVWEGVLLHW